jgi:PPOX class probable F420-dependent enzyme
MVESIRMETGSRAFERFVRQRVVLLTTFRRDGIPVGTPVNIAVEGGKAFVRTYDKAGKMKRLRRNPEVEVAPSTLLGKPTGPATRARARILTGDEAEQASRAISRKHPITQGVMVPLAHRLRRYRTVHMELTPLGEEGSTS